MSAPTVRRYPRTLAEAFPRDYACAIERPPHRVHAAEWVVALLAVLFVIAAACGWI